ncbi:cell wall hydrolase [Sphingobium sp.]|uniref:cell wall hydrolase n=1 Tax=Sphingobium sp. TaxID=1912891 RepID=UPI003BB7B2B6
MKVHVTEAEKETRPARHRPAIKPGLIVGIVAVLIVVGAIVALGMSGGGRHSATVSAPIRASSLDFNPASITATDPSQLQPVSAEDAEAINAAIPISKQANPAAAALFVPTANMSDLSRSLECLTTAVYYEAASEPIDGQRAVAQVILNRVRHPSFPHSVCDVVFQGSERVTGCQFSFTCDGAMARRPLAALWKQARLVAADALTGTVYKPVGWATHYHADYVSPYWAPTLTKLAVVGRHIFYRLPGAAGGPSSFSVRYAGGEPDMAAIIEAALEATDGLDGNVAGAIPTIAPLAERPILNQAGDIVGKSVSVGPAASAPKTPEAAPSSPAPVARRWILSREQPLPPANAPATSAPPVVAPTQR